MPHTNENLKNESGFRFQDLPSNLIEEFHRLKARLTEGKAIYFNPNLKLLVISNNPKSPHLSSYKQVKYSYQYSSLWYAEGTKNINLQRQKCELIK